MEPDGQATDCKPVTSEFDSRHTLQLRNNMNIIISSSKWLVSDIKTLFGNEKVTFTLATEIPNLMVELGLYPSTSKARQANRKGTVPSGWTEMKGNKQTPIWIWNPCEH